MTCQHQWQPTGEEDIHAVFPTPNDGRRRLFAKYVRCAHCGQDGFRKPHHAVVYTWCKDESCWEA